MWWRERKATRTAVPCRGWGIMKQYRLCGQGLAFPKNCKDAYRVARQSHLQVFNSNESHSHMKSCTQRFPAALFITAENVEEKLWYVHITERYSAVKRNELLTHKQLGSGTTESKRNQSQKVPYVRFHLYDLLECKINSDRDR